MDLIFWRHAEAFEAEGGEDDMTRSLTPRGERQATRMAHWLDRQLPDGVRILCSPAKRAEQTVMALGRKYKIRDELSPQSQPDQVLELAQWPHNKNSVLIVGHQPFLGQTIAKLLYRDSPPSQPLTVVFSFLINGFLVQRLPKTSLNKN